MNSKRVNQNSLSIVLPAYNEEGNIVEAVRSALRFLKKRFLKYEVIVVNDGSKDKTESLVNELAQKNNHIVLISHQKNAGYGQTVYDGLRAAKSDLVFFTDSDLQFDLNELDEFLDQIDDYDVIIGYRRRRSEGLIRKVNMVGWKLLLRIFLGLKTKDIDCAFKLFKKEVLKSLKINSGGAMFSAELIYRIAKKNGKIMEMPVSHFPRKTGRPTGANVKVIIRALKELATFKR